MIETLRGRPWPDSKTFASLAMRIAIVAALLGLTMALPVVAQRQPTAATITLNPSAATIVGCETIRVEAWINDVSDLYGADVRLSFDPAVVEVVDFDPDRPGFQLEPGDFLGPPLWTVLNSADNTAGTIAYATTQLHPAEPVSGSGVLVIIHLRAKAAGSSDLQFTSAGLAAAGGTWIPGTPVDGTVSTTPLGAATLSIARLDATTARLTWGAVSGSDEYHLYRDTTPYFTPAAPVYHTTTGLTYDDVGALGDTVTQHYYVLRASCSTGFEGANSNRVGEYDYALTAAAAANYNDIAVVLDNASIYDAATLAAYIGGSAMFVMRYNGSTQSFQIHIAGDPGTNFSLSVGDAVMVVTSNTAPASVALVGNVPAPGSVAFSLVSDSSPKYNFLSLPLDRDDLTTASDVAVDVGSGVLAVMRYQISSQSFQIYIPGDPGTDFSLAIGEPFWLLLTAGAPANWP